MNSATPAPVISGQWSVVSNFIRRRTLLTALLPTALLATALLALAPSARGKLPELDAIYYGQVRHNGGDLLVPDNAGQIIIKAVLNGVVISQAVMPELSSNYLIKVPLDDGVEPRLPGTARFGERVHIFVRNTETSAEYETTESTGLGLSISSVKGDVQAQDISVTGDLGGLGPAFAAYGAWAGGFPSLPQGGSGAGLDSDGDGSSNLQEFVANTDPTNGGDRFQILETRHTNGVTSLRYGPIRLSRVYSIYYSLNLQDGTWVKVAEIVPNAIAPWRWQDILDSGQSELFFKLEVDVQ